MSDARDVVRCPRCGQEYWIDRAALLPIVGDDVASDETTLEAAVIDIASALGVHPCRPRVPTYGGRLKGGRKVSGPPRCGSCGCPPEDHLKGGTRKCKCGRCGGWQGR